MSSDNPAVEPSGLLDAFGEKAWATESLGNDESVPVIIRHNLDPVLVTAEIERAVLKHEQFRIETKRSIQVTQAAYAEALAKNGAKGWHRPPSGPEYVDPMVDEWIAHERTHYAKVRVLEKHCNQVGRCFLLAYGDTPDKEVWEGTGPFMTFDEAARWFLGSGR